MLHSMPPLAARPYMISVWSRRKWLSRLADSMLPRQLGRIASATPAQDTYTRYTSPTHQEQLSIWTRHPAIWSGSRRVWAGISSRVWGPRQLPGGSHSAVVDPTWVYAPPRMCQYPAGTVNPQQHTYQGRTGRGSSGTRAAQVAPLLPGKHPHLRAPLCKVQVEFHCGMQAGNIWMRTPPRWSVYMYRWCDDWRVTIVY